MGFIFAYHTMENDYRFMGKIAYRKSIHKWLGFAPYTLRTAMHEAGTDLATIAKQSGNKNLETINKHYLSVNDKTVDKFL